jgi:hypothetical protein
MTALIATEKACGLLTQNGAVSTATTRQHIHKALKHY